MPWFFCHQIEKRTACLPSAIEEKGESASGKLSAAFDRSGHFDYSRQFWLIITIGCRAFVFGAQQTHGNPQSVHLLADSDQFLLLRSQHFVRVFHLGEGLAVQTESRYTIHNRSIGRG
jgi:hypothetical protein